jgi:hypothetical protein
MKQHDLDPVSLFFGLVFVFVSGAYLLSQTTDLHLQWLLAVPAGLIALGIAILGSTVRKMQHAERGDEV